MRTFIAVGTDEDVQETLARALAQLRTRVAGVKWAEPAHMHLTLRFLGEVADRQLPDVFSAAQEAAASVEPFTLRLGAPKSFGGAAPRVLLLDVLGHTDVLGTLQETLERGLEARGFGREGRPFSPHLTLGRPRKGAVPVTWRDFTLSGVTEWTVEELTVYSSDLTPDGPIYTALAHCPLRGEA